MWPATKLTQSQLQTEASNMESNNNNIKKSSAAGPQVVSLKINGKYCVLPDITVGFFNH